MACWRGVKHWRGPFMLALVLSSVPHLSDDFRAYQLGTYLLYGVAAQGVALAWGRAGFLPLGQALFFGLGAYSAGMVLIASQANATLLALLPLAVLLPAALAYAIARLVFARQYVSGPNFSLITLALAMLAAQLANQWSGLTGGFNGLANIPEIGGLDRYSTVYYLIVALVVASTALLGWLYRTPLGALWLAVAQNENRLQFFGFATDRLKALAFALAGALAASAGTLYATQQGLVTPQAIGFELSTELVIWTAVGGRFGPYGALLGAVGIGLLSAELRDVWIHWQVAMALIFILVVLRFPAGMAGALQTYGRRLWPRSWMAGEEPLSSQSAAAPNYLPAPPRNRAADTSTLEPIRLEFNRVNVRIQGVSILSGLQLHLRGAGIHCIIGPNGAGKTSSFNALTGRLPLSDGDIHFSGRRVSGLRADTIARMGIARKFQIPSVFSALSVRDNLCIALWGNRANALQLLQASTWRWRSTLLEFLIASFPFLETESDRHAGELSQGQRQMLELAMTLLMEPRLLLLDEPCAGLSVAETGQQTDVIKRAVTLIGCTALVIEHDMAAVARLSDQVHVLHQGRLLASGSLADIQGNPDVQAVYSGGQK